MAWYFFAYNFSETHHTKFRSGLKAKIELDIEFESFNSCLLLFSRAIYRMLYEEKEEVIYSREQLELLE